MESEFMMLTLALLFSLLSLVRSSKSDQLKWQHLPCITFVFLKNCDSCIYPPVFM